MSKYAVMKNWRWWALLPILLAAYYIGTAAELAVKAAQAVNDATWRIIQGDEQ